LPFWLETGDNPRRKLQNALAHSTANRLVWRTPGTDYLVGQASKESFDAVVTFALKLSSSCTSVCALGKAGATFSRRCPVVLPMLASSG
jgi:hypothetical protein